MLAIGSRTAALGARRSNRAAGLIGYGWSVKERGTKMSTLIGLCTWDNRAGIYLDGKDRQRTDTVRQLRRDWTR